MNTGLSLNCVLIAIMILGIILVLGGSKETFMSAPYPQSVEKGILYDDYPMAANPGLSSATYKTQWKQYPVWAVGSYAQQTNNLRYWKMPCNGLATPPDMCGGLYTAKNIVTSPSKVPARHCERVNYYCT